MWRDKVIKEGSLSKMGKCVFQHEESALGISFISQLFIFYFCSFWKRKLEFYH